MSRALIVSFDLVRDGEPATSFSVATLLAAARAQPGAPELHHAPFNLLATPPPTADDVVHALASDYHLGAFGAIALSAYVWSEALVRPVLRGLRAAGFQGRLLLGGYQVSYADPEALHRLYPEADVFVSGYAETALLDALADPRPGPQLHAASPDFHALPSPYLTGTLPVAVGQDRVRLETKRGCPYRCSFCAHRDLATQRVHRRGPDRALAELDWLAERGVAKVNVLDPVFNMGPEYLPFLRALAERPRSGSARSGSAGSGSTSAPVLSVQARIENVRGPAGDEFLDLAAGLGLTLEFGLQSIHPDELTAVDRRNALAHTEAVLARLNDRGIAYEVSVIYGLPRQSARSFDDTLDFLDRAGAPVVRAFPLMLLRGTELYDERDRYGFVEAALGPFAIPTVVASDSFSHDEWLAMDARARALFPSPDRV